MANEYLDNEDLKFKFEKIDLSKTMAELKKKFTASQNKSRRGSLNQISDLREQTAKLLNKPFMQVSRLTKNWSIENLYTTLHISKQFINPPALWWVLYKKNKENYGKQKTNTRTISRVGKKGRNQDQAVRQETLF